MPALLEVDNLQVCYNGVDIIKEVTLSLQRAEILCLVGESGCGKSTLLRALMRMTGSEGSIAGGQIFFNGIDLVSASEELMRQLRGAHLAVVFQNPGTSLNPIRKIANQFIETMRSHNRICKKEAFASILDMLAKLNLPDGHRILESYPFELSGGMNQRVAIALAMIMQPELLLADEPTDALDVSAQAQVIAEMMKLRDKFGTSIIMVTHNMGIVAKMADKVGVMYAGQIVEYGNKHAVLSYPRHPYTRALIDAIPVLNGKLPQGIEGSPPSFDEPKQGCTFANRCRFCQDECLNHDPFLLEVVLDHWTSCRVLLQNKVVLS
jgi:peptide/nickel transport system ATP-binding protein